VTHDDTIRWRKFDMENFKPPATCHFIFSLLSLPLYVKGQKKILFKSPKI
jgi:hypothetical protein